MLAGLLLLVPLIALHLRNRGNPVRKVPSLLVWRELDTLPAIGSRGRRLPALPLLLLLQAAAIVFLVFALAEPQLNHGTPTPGRVIVLDDSLWMSPAGRLTVARDVALHIVHSAPPGAPISIVLADASPATIYRGNAAGARAVLARVRPTAAPADLATALRVASGTLDGVHDRIEVIRAPQDAMPATNAAPGELSDITVGPTVSDQGIFDASARCGIGSPSDCEVYATVVNASRAPAVDRYTAQAIGRVPLKGNVDLAAGASAEIALLADPGENVELSLPARDGLADDDTAAVTVPGAGGVPSGTVVTLVGTRKRSLALAQALVSVPGVHVRLSTPAQYSPADADRSTLLVLDGWLPAGPLPAAPATLLVDPPRLPDGRVGGTLSDTVVSGTDATSPLLSGVDLSSLDVNHGTARDLTLPPWLTAAVWSPSGPLLSAGDNGRRRLAVLAFEPARSNLPQLSSFPVLIANLVAWASRWAPPSASAGTPILVDATPGARSASLSRAGAVIERTRLRGRPASFVVPEPGFYTVTERGPRIDRTAQVAVSATTPVAASSTPVDLRIGLLKQTSAPKPLEPWFLAAALLALVLEASYWATRRIRTIA